MKLITIFRFEFAYLVQRISTWLYLATLFLFTIIMNLLTTPGDGVYANNTLHITGITVIGVMIWLVIGASIAGEAAARDVKMQMHPLTYTTPVTKLDYLGGRFLAAFTVNAILILSLPLGVMFSFYLPLSEPEPLLPFRGVAYLNVYFLIALPNVFITTALQFSMAALSRHVMSSYMASLLLAIVAQVAAIAISRLIGNWDLVKLLDPIGIAGIIGSELATWTPSEKNTRLLVLNGMFLWNRILWLSIAAVVLVFSYLQFNFSYTDSKSWWSRFRLRRIAARETNNGIMMDRPIQVDIPTVKRNDTLTTYCLQVLTIAWASFKKIARHPAGLTMVAIVALLSVVFSDRIMTQFEIPLYPTTQQIISYLANPVNNLSTPWVIIPLLIIYFTGVLTWQERDAGLSEIADAAPVSEWVLIAGKLLGLMLLVFAWILVMMACGKV
ncbi:MAG: hypothetical protein EOP49_15735, partial [Sphingobacteriales bacterium]